MNLLSGWGSNQHNIHFSILCSGLCARLKAQRSGLSWWCGGWESACQCGDKGLIPVREDSTHPEQLSLCTTAAEAHAWACSVGEAHTATGSPGSPQFREGPHRAMRTSAIETNEAVLKSHSRMNSVSESWWWPPPRSGGNGKEHSGPWRFPK